MTTLLPAVTVAYVPFLDPLPVWGVWYLLILPLCVGIATVWKSIKCRSMDEVPRDAAILVAWILGGFAAAAVALAVLVKVVNP